MPRSLVSRHWISFPLLFLHTFWRGLLRLQRPIIIKISFSFCYYFIFIRQRIFSSNPAGHVHIAVLSFCWQSYPFEGMKYPPNSQGLSAHTKKKIYEHECICIFYYFYKVLVPMNIKIQDKSERQSMNSYLFDDKKIWMCFCQSMTVFIAKCLILVFFLISNISNLSGV